MTDRESGDRADATLKMRRLELDIDDLRFENERLKASMAEKQDEIMTLSDRLGVLQARLDRLHRVAAWGRLRRLNPVRLFARWMG